MPLQILPLTRRSITLAALVLLAACGASQTSLLPSGDETASNARQTVENDRHALSWMAQGVNQRDLLYVSNQNGTVSVYRYWQHNLVGVLTNFKRPMGECSDTASHVYVTDYVKGVVAEYAHGGTKPLRVIHDRGPYGCSVSPKNGDLAVANYGYYSRDRSRNGPDYYQYGAIAIYKPGSSNPTLYGNRDDHFVACAYDDHGDLLATSQNGYSEYYSTDFDYLPKGGTKLISLELPNPYTTSGWYYRYVSGIAWDGKYWVVDTDGELYRYTINIKAQFVDTISTSATYNDRGPIALYRKTPKSLATQAVSGSSDSGSRNAVDYFKYPIGGTPIDSITEGLDAPYGVAVSRRTK